MDKCTYIVLVILIIISYSHEAWLTRDSLWISRGGGIISLVGFLMTTIATIRVEKDCNSKKISEDCLFLIGITFSFVGIVVWTLGDLIKMKF